MAAVATCIAAKRAITVTAYFPEACIDGESVILAKGSDNAGTGTSSSLSVNNLHQISSPPIPATKSITEIIEQIR